MNNPSVLSRDAPNTCFSFLTLDVTNHPCNHNCSTLRGSDGVCSASLEMDHPVSSLLSSPDVVFMAGSEIPNVVSAFC